MVVTTGFGPVSLCSSRSGGTLTKELSVWRKNKRAKRSIVWQVPSDILRDIVKAATTFGDVLKVLELPSIGGNIKTLKTRLNEEWIDYQHIPTGRAANKGIARGGFTWSNTLMFTTESEIARGVVRKRLLRDKLIPYTCAICSSDPIWQDKPMSLVLDHINGIRNDHRLENLRFVCPNCNSQLDTHCSKNKNNPDSSIW